MQKVKFTALALTGLLLVGGLVGYFISSSEEDRVTATSSNNSEENVINSSSGNLVSSLWAVSAPARGGAPESTVISSNKAIQSSFDYAKSIGITNASFNYIYMDLENGTWVWSVELNGGGRDLEFYVDVNTGDFLKVPNVGTSISSNQGEKGGNHPNNINTTISLEHAIEIAYEDLAIRGISANYRANSGIDREKGQRVWELEFRGGGNVVEYYINVDTGEIVKFESELDD